MRFDIKCATFVRLASICNFFEPETPQEIRDQINTVRLEAVNGKIFAIATNQRIAAIEYVGNTDPRQNGVAHIVLHPSLIAQCKVETFLDGTLTINTIPEIANAMAQTSSGWCFPGNACHWFDQTIMDEWRLWAPDETIKKSEGIMVWTVHLVQALFESSPSGKILFPRHIDANKPLVLRDLNNPYWVGLFIPAAYGNPSQKQAAELPDWWHA